MRMSIVTTAAAGATSTVATAANTVSTAGRRVCFLTDTEGSWGFVRRFVRQSTCLELLQSNDNETTTSSKDSMNNESSGNNETLHLRDDCVLVFGGDAGDKGDDTLRCVLV